MEELSSKKLIIIVLLLLVIAFGSGILIGKNYFAKGSEEIVAIEPVEENVAPINKTIRVYVAGEVKSLMFMSLTMVQLLKMRLCLQVALQRMLIQFL